MLGFAALAEVALAEIPSGTGAEPIPIFVRAPTGKVFITDAQAIPIPITLGDNPLMGESCALIFVIPWLRTVPLQITFTSPSGASHAGDTSFAWIGSNTIIESQTRTIPNFGAEQYVVYLTGVGELNEVGAWTVNITSNTLQTGTIEFNVVLAH